MSYIFGPGNKFTAFCIAWPLSLTLIFGAMSAVSNGVLFSALFLLIASALIMPVTRQLIWERWGKDIPLKPLIAFSAMLTLTAGVMFVGHSMELDQAQFQERQAVAQKAAQEAADAEAIRLASLTPEERAKEEAEREKAETDRQAKQEKERKAAQAAALLDNVKGYEAFLIADEEYYATNKASDADLEKIRKTLVLFSAMAEQLDTARHGKADLSAENIAYMKGIEKRLSTLQQKALPGLRLAFKKRAAELLWEHDVDVYVSGTGNTIIEFTSGMFAARANIKSTQEQIHEIVVKLRFKKTRFSWYKGADETYSYTLDTPSDAKLAPFKFGEFQEMAAVYP